MAARAAGAPVRRVMVTKASGVRRGLSSTAKVVLAVDTSRYPVDLLDGANGVRMINRCHAQMREQGFVALPGFLNSDAAAAMLDEALALETQGGGFYSTEAHSIHLDDEWSSSALAGLPETHPRCVQQSSSKLLFAADQLDSASSPLRDLYDWPPMLSFVRSALDEPSLHLSADPMGRCYLNLFGAGDQLGWHFDNSTFSVSLILQPSEGGGAFEFAPASRCAVEVHSPEHRGTTRKRTERH